MSRAGDSHGDHDHGDRTVVAQSHPWPHPSDDPTATKTLRAQYSGEMYRRFRALKGVIREAVVERDVFGISGGGNSPGPGEAAPDLSGAARDYAALQNDPGLNLDPPEPGAYAFPSDRRKVDEFMSWVEEQSDRGVLERRVWEQREVSAAEPWQNVYLRDSYRKGVQHADAAMVGEGVISDAETLDDVFRAPKHADAAGMLFTRAFRELDGVTSAMGQEMSRELTEGLLQGENPRKIARRLNDRVDNVGLHRGRLIARTETIRAHNEAALNRYGDTQERLDGVTNLAEHLTAGDRRVCPICRGLAGKTYTIEDARGRIPVHPNCRCTWVPIRSGKAPRAAGTGPSALPPGDADGGGGAGPSVSRTALHEGIENLGDDADPQDYANVVSQSDAPVSADFAEFDSEQANLAARLVADMDANGELDGLGSRGNYATTNIRSKETPGDSGGAFSYTPDTRQREIRLDPDTFGIVDRDLEDIGSSTRQALASGWRMSVRDGFLAAEEGAIDRHIFIHELGHARHFSSLLGRDDVDVNEWWSRTRNYRLDADERDYLESLSEYAAENPLEAVAETYAARVQGFDVDDRVVAFARSFEGPIPDDESEFLVATEGLDALQGGDLPSFLADEAAATFEAFAAWAEQAGGSS